MKMEEWKECKLGEYLYIKGRIGWKGLKKDEYLNKSPYRIINGESLTEKGIEWSKAGFITKERYDESPEIMLEINDILLSKDGTIGKIGFVKELLSPTTVASGIFVIRNIKPEIIDTMFIYHFLRSSKFKNFIKMRTEGSVIPHLYQKDFEELNFPLPPLSIQQKIAAILSSLDDKIELNNKINTNLEQQAQALFKNWFVDNDSNLTEIEIGKLDILITDYVANGSFKDLADNVKYLTEETNNVLIRLTDYNNNFASDMVYISDKSYDFLEKSKLYGDEIIISNVGANVGTVFRCPRLSKRMSLAPNSIMIRANNYEHYLYLFFTSAYGQGLLKSIVTGSAQPKFNKTNFRSLKIKIPNEEQLSMFNNIYDSIHEKIINNQKENMNLASIRDTLLPKLMNGEIEVD